MAFVSDSFTDTDDTTLQSHTGETGATWTEHPNESGTDAKIISNAAKKDSAGAVSYYASGTPATNEYDVEVVCGFTTSSGVGAGCSGRLLTTANTGYLAWGSSNTVLYKLTAGTFGSIGAYASGWNSGTVVKLEIRTAAKSVYLDGGGTPVITNGDDTHTGAGRAGLRFFGSGGILESFSATDAGGTTQYNQSASGTLSFAAGALANSAEKTLAGALSFAGAALKSVAAGVAGTLSFAGALAGIRTVLVAVAGTLSFASGAVVNSTSKGIAGTLSFAGSIVKAAQRAISGTLSFAGDAAGIRTILQAIGGTLSFAGATLQSVGKQASGTLSFASGAVVRSVGKGAAGTLSFAGGIGKQVAKGVSGVLAFVGALLGTIVGAPAAPNMPPTDRRVTIGAESRFVVIGIEDRYIEVSA